MKIIKCKSCSNCEKCKELNRNISVDKKIKNHIERDNTIIQAILNGENSTTLANKYNLSRDRITKIFLHSGNVRPPSPNIERNKQICIDLINGDPLRKVAEKYNLSITRVKGILIVRINVYNKNYNSWETSIKNVRRNKSKYLKIINGDNQ